MAKKFRVVQNEGNRLWYLQKKNIFGIWVDVVDSDGNKVSDASWAGNKPSNGITGKADRWIFENVIDANWRYSG